MAPKRSAFTLVELLVVVAIIATLIAIILPGLRAARESAKQVLCLSNERQIGVVVFEYALENDDYLMREVGVHRGPDWSRVVRKVLTRGGGRKFADVGVFQCPSFPIPDQSMLPNTYRVREPAEQHLDYVTNGFGRDGKSDQIENKLTNIRRAAELVYLAEASRYIPMIEVKIRIPGGRASLHDAWDQDHLPGPDVGWDRPWYMAMRVGRDRHNGNVNVIHMDGHGESVRTKKLSELSMWIDEFVR